MAGGDCGSPPRRRSRSGGGRSRSKSDLRLVPSPSAASLPDRPLTFTADANLAGSAPLASSLPSLGSGEVCSLNRGTSSHMDVCSDGSVPVDPSVSRPRSPALLKDPPLIVPVQSSRMSPATVDRVCSPSCLPTLSSSLPLRCPKPDELFAAGPSVPVLTSALGVADPTPENCCHVRSMADQSGLGPTSGDRSLSGLVPAGLVDVTIPVGRALSPAVRVSPLTPNDGSPRLAAWSTPARVRFSQVEEPSVFTRPGGVVALDLGQAQSNLRHLEPTLIGSLLGRRIPFWVVKADLLKRWGPRGLTRVSPLGMDCFLCWFASEEARNEILLGGPWFVAGHIIGLDRWSPSLSVSSLRGFSSPVWIRLPNLPLEYWDNINLGRLASAVGEPLFMDGLTSEFHRCAYARLCVRLDLGRPLPTGIWAEGFHGRFFQPVHYEGIPSLCQSCGRIGHNSVKCSFLVPPSRPHSLAKDAPAPPAEPTPRPSPAAPLLRASTAEVTHADSPIQSVSSDPLVGEWTIVSRRRPRRPSRPAPTPDSRGRTPSRTSRSSKESAPLLPPAPPFTLAEPSIPVAPPPTRHPIFAPSSSSIPPPALAHPSAPPRALRLSSPAAGDLGPSPPVLTVNSGLSSTPRKRKADRVGLPLRGPTGEVTPDVDMIGGGVSPLLD
ncbi:hypothetical protein M5K25_009030 [Dendrobium thyrsiflorum]|uniref:DUF4283 domain-containing protein n=1 Tax=Dendrobium thyrsiflorum TaxID=117978 RepID=A0ABD0V3Y8_DENTH